MRACYIVSSIAIGTAGVVGIQRALKLDEKALDRRGTDRAMASPLGNNYHIAGAQSREPIVELNVKFAFDAVKEFIGKLVDVKIERAVCRLKHIEHMPVE